MVVFTPLRKQDGLKRLSNLFELDELALSHEFQNMHNIAEAHFKQAGCSNRDAWRWAYRRACHNRSDLEVAQFRHCNLVCLLAYIFWLGRGMFFSMTSKIELFQVLAAYMAWSASTSSVEQTFPKLSTITCSVDARMPPMEIHVEGQLWG